MTVIPRPAAGDDYAAYDGCLARLDGDDALAVLRRAAVETPRQHAGLDGALAWIIAAHEHHHLAILRDRYGIGG
jgi:hypothetical protein